MRSGATSTSEADRSPTRTAASAPSTPVDAPPPPASARDDADGADRAHAPIDGVHAPGPITARERWLVQTLLTVVLVGTNLVGALITVAMCAWVIPIPSGVEFSLTANVIAVPDLRGGGHRHRHAVGDHGGSSGTSAGRSRAARRPRRRPARRYGCRSSW